MKIVVLDGYAVNPGDNPWPNISEYGELLIHDRTSPDTLLDHASCAEILVTNKTPIQRHALDLLPELRFISVLATGYNVVDIEAAKDRGILVSNVPHYGTDAVAQFTIGLILELCHHIGDHAHSVATGEWSSSLDWTYSKSPQIELDGLTLGVVGFGRIGQRVAELANAFGMNILYSSRSNLEVRGVSALRVSTQTLFSEADIISLHCSLTETTREFVDRRLVRQMKPTAFLINTARGQLINEMDLADALRNGAIAGAALDVLSAEPPIVSNPLLTAPRCLITPHIAWASLAARQRILQTTLLNITSFLRGQPINVVNE